ncbi:MAG: hypothetical protein K9J37_23215 [Saprospiraceae bacterium]|nr:hypothetical protein [Saprospiraceae bacterium]MCF8252836.1 hypothetical protein [Saprospiraceae bacterium]MCF8283280.1 hypothetical protein [Bacteroidales bacterium]MCF8314393.1 hypothetical protein [Saprospiraceae bacterium]MCF8443277.1 hypothetical protein [Saprospiraceae bacterium]
MSNLSIFLASLFVLALVSCQPKKQELLVGAPVKLDTRSIQQNKGTDCDKQPDSLRTDCAIIDFSVPKLGGTAAQSTLTKSVDAWVDKFLVHLLIYSDYPESNPAKALTNVDAAIKRYHAIHDEAEGAASAGQFKVMCTNGEMLNDGKYLTLMLDGYSFQGGNHHLEEVAIATFDVKTGKQLTLADLVNDTKTLLPIAQAKVEETRADAFNEGFEFDKEAPFALPASYGLTSDGLLMHYSPDEIYQLGGATEFTVAYSELGTNLKITAPIAPATDAASTDASDIYEVDGDSLVIPTFEIEVLESAKAAATMQKKKETVIVFAGFAGEPINPKDADEIGEFAILNKEIELTGRNRIARFEGLKFSKKQLDKLKDKDIRLLINVYSGRKASKDNLLSCNLVDAVASQFGGKRYSLGCALIEESPDGSLPPVASFALPADGSKSTAPLPLVVDCTEKGEISFAGIPVKDMDELKSTLRKSVSFLLKSGAKAMPEIQTQGCMMGMQGTIRDTYEELKNEMQPTGKKPAETNAPAEKSTGTASPKTETKPAALPKTTKAKPAPPAYPTITLNEKGDMTLDGKKVATFEDLRKQLQPILLTYDAIPDDVPIKTTGTTGMGTRAEMRTEIADAIAGAKWLRKKAALEAMSSSVGKKLETAVQLEVGTYQTSGNFAFVDARPKTADGKAIDYTKTTYKDEFAKGKFADRALGLLQYANGKWTVLAYNIGTNVVPVDAWVKGYKAPKSLFAKGK